MLTNSDNTIIRVCEVISIDDDFGGDRIKVRLPIEDANKSLNDIPFCTPILPKHLHIKPKLGESVLVILETQGNPNGNRFYIGPLIAQDYDLEYDPYKYSSRSLLSGKQYVKPLPNPKTNPNNKGSQPNDKDISILGRVNEEVSLKDNEILLRVGHKQKTKKRENRLNYNDKDYAFIQMRYKEYIDKKYNKDYNSMINIVADRINLLSHDSVNYFETITKDELISDETLDKIITEAHPLVYGDVLIDYLKALIRIIKEHTHPFNMLPPSLSQTDVEVLNTDLTKFISKTIKIN